MPVSRIVYINVIVELYDTAGGYSPITFIYTILETGTYIFGYQLDVGITGTASGVTAIYGFNTSFGVGGTALPPSTNVSVATHQDRVITPFIDNFNNTYTDFFVAGQNVAVLYTNDQDPVFMNVYPTIPLTYCRFWGYKLF